MSTPTSTFTTTVRNYDGSNFHEKSDTLTVEEPLEIRVVYGAANNRQRTTVAVTMRTPGHDTELAIGYLFTEGLLNHSEDLLAVAQADVNVVRVDLHPTARVELDRLNRRGVVASSCSTCGKTTLDAIETTCERIGADHLRIKPSLLAELHGKLQTAQTQFAQTGGLHAAALGTREGELRILREDVGRHNALDKLIGQAFLNRQMPLSESVLFVTARASFELLQKAAMAGIPIFAAVGAPSSLAVQVARQQNITLIGFIREGRFNLYTGEHRVHMG